MRAIAPFFGVVASTVTIFAAVVRLWWSKPKLRKTSEVRDDFGVAQVQYDRRPKGPTWLQTAAKWWLIGLFWALMLGAVAVLVTIAIRIINMSN